MSQVLLVGSPNSGKSLLFNKLTGLNQKVANFPGITVGTHSGHSRHYPDLELVDFPGVYSMHGISGEENIALEALSHAMEEGDVSCVLCVVDSTRLEKGLVFALQLQDMCTRYGKRLVVAANMQDVLNKHGLDFNADGLGEAMNITVVPLSAKTGAGLETLEEILSQPKQVNDQGRDAGCVNPDIIGRDDNAFRTDAEQLAKNFGPKGDLLLKTHSRADAFFLSSFTGGVSFLLITGSFQGLRTHG